ncbi:MAG: hypothetical protein Q9195_008526 [Heterodermia aff. obscurata]
MANTSKISSLDRTFSTAGLERLRLRLVKNQADLKRKLSACPSENEIELGELCLRELSETVSMEHLRKDWLDIEKQSNTILPHAYKTKIKKSNRRINRLGKKLWKYSKILRDLEEKAGLAPRLGPDAHRAYVPILLKLYKDPSSFYTRSMNLQINMKEKAIKKYASHVGAPKGQLWCPILGDYYPSKAFKAVHIVPHALGPELVDYVFGPGAGSRLDSADNCLLMHRDAQLHFDSGSIVLVPAVPSETPIKTWKIRITNWAPAAGGDKAGLKSLGDLENTIVNFRHTDERPAVRFLYFRFALTLLRNKRDRTPGWEHYFRELSIGRPFAAMGPYIRKSMMVTLARAAGHFYGVYEANVLGTEGKELFAERRVLGDREEEEVARRILRVKDEDDED